MSNKSQTIFAVCFGLFLAVVVTVSLLFADKLPHATQLAIRTKTALASKSGEGYIDTAVKIIIGVVVGGVILVGLYALFKNVVLVNLNSEITDMFNYTA